MNLFILTILTNWHIYNSLYKEQKGIKIVKEPYKN